MSLDNYTKRMPIDDILNVVNMQ